MNFRHLNEAFDRLNEKALNEGPGAGYTIKGTAVIKVDNVKILSKEDNEYDTTYEVSFNGNGTADIEFASYYYGGSLEDVPVVATKAYVDVDTNDINNGYTVEQYIESLLYNEELKIDLIYGGGWSHSTYDGTVASEEYQAENTYADTRVTDMKIIDEDTIQYIDDVVQGNYEDDDYFEESLSDDIRRGNLDYDDEIDAHYKKNGNVEVQFQDRNSNTHIQRNPKDMSSKFEKHPRVSSHTWGRVWKDGNLVKSVNDSKYGARQEIAKYLDDNSMGESLKESEDITYTPKVRRFKSADGSNRIINQYYEEPNYPNWGKGERNKKEISDDEYNRFLQTGKLKEDASKEWKPNTSFAHIKKIYNDVKKRGYKYVNNEREEMHAAMDKVDARGYTPEQRKQIRSWTEEIWRAHKKNESLKESYDDVNSSNAFDVLYDMVELFGCEEMLDALAKAMGTSDLADNLTYICRQYEYDPNPDSDYVDESLTESTSRKEREKAYNDLKKFIVKFCNVEWSDEYMDLVIYAVLNSNANVKSNYMNIEDTCSNMLGNYPYAWSTLKEHFGDKQTRYLLGYFVNDVKDIMSKYYSKDESLTEERGNYGHKGPFWYHSKHGMGPGTIPPDVNVVDWYEDDNYNTWIALDGVLTTQELREYELKEQKPPIEGV